MERCAALPPTPWLFDSRSCHQALVLYAASTLDFPPRSTGSWAESDHLKRHSREPRRTATAIELTTKRAARGSAPLMCRRLSEIRFMLRSAMRCTSECRFGCARMFRLTTLCRWLASFNKEKHDEGAPFLDETDVPYTTGPQSLRAGLPPLDLATTKDVLRHYAVLSDGTLDPQ